MWSANCAKASAFISTSSDLPPVVELVLVYTEERGCGSVGYAELIQAGVGGLELLMEIRAGLGADGNLFDARRIAGAAIAADGRVARALIEDIPCFCGDQMCAAFLGNEPGEQ